ncbi:MAG: acyltransferase [Chitinivibrionales bacterium]|nr:acyltransferase [Chitinivibrionales bacterium]
MIEWAFNIASRIWTRIYTAVLAAGFYRIGCCSVVVPPLRFSNLRSIQIGNNVTIQSDCWLQVVRDGRTKADDPKLIIKDHAEIGMGASISAAKKIVIEEHVLLARNVYISDHGHEFEDITRPISEQGIRKATEVRIGAQTWIGQNAVILPGASIGKHCIIGANAVVNGVIPDYSVVAGAPARIVKRYDAQAKAWVAVGHP